MSVGDDTSVENFGDDINSFGSSPADAQDSYRNDGRMENNMSNRLTRVKG